MIKNPNLYGIVHLAGPPMWLPGLCGQPRPSFLPLILWLIKNMKQTKDHAVESPGSELPIFL